MTIAMYATIWIALALFVAAELGKSRFATASGPAPWAWAAWTMGGILAAVHVLIAIDVRYGWNHAAAVRETARQSAQVYSFEWQGSIYVSYLFVVTWLAESWRWRRTPDLYQKRAPAVTWALRAFFFLIIVNGAVVFAAMPGRILGVVLVIGLSWAWFSPAAAALKGPRYRRSRA